MSHIRHRWAAASASDPVKHLDVPCRSWSRTLADALLDATVMGFHEFDALLPENGPGAADEAERRLRELRRQVEAVPAGLLNDRW